MSGRRTTLDGGRTAPERPSQVASNTSAAEVPTGLTSPIPVTAMLRATMVPFSAGANRYDLIIDDGSHFSAHQILTFEHLFDARVRGTGLNGRAGTGSAPSANMDFEKQW